jgi:hypothetical protein
VMDWIGFDVTRKDVILSSFVTDGEKGKQENQL